jgi:hypothetical protein
MKMDLFEKFADSIEFCLEDGTLVKDKIAFIDEKLEESEEKEENT